MKEYQEDEKDSIRELLIGRKVVKVADDTLQLDDGIRLKFVGHEGACCCESGDYDLTELNGVDNIITSVEFEDLPCGDAYPGREYPGTYKIFVFAANQKINLATFEGSDGNGYYGTGYKIIVEDVKA